jgi:hypothetical protein
MTLANGILANGILANRVLTNRTLGKRAPGKEHLLTRRLRIGLLQMPHPSG